MGISGCAILADLRRVDIDVNHARMRRKRRQAPGDAIVETHAQRDQQIASGHAHVGGIAAVHAGHADEIRMFGRQRAQAHQSADRRRIHALDQLAQLALRAGSDDAAARIHHGPLGFPDHLRRAPDLARMAFAWSPGSRAR